MKLAISNHAERRMQQRGIRETDLDLIRRYGTHIEDDDEVILLTNTDTTKEILKRKWEIQALERLRGCKVVISQGNILTVYRTTLKHRKYAMRRCRSGD